MSDELSDVPGSYPNIEDPKGLLSPPETQVLKEMFVGDQWVQIVKQFENARTACRVFEVKYLTGDEVVKRSVVKIGPKDLIEKECQAYRKWVKDVLLDKVPHLDQPELSEACGDLSGLRYTLVAGSGSPVETLHHYYRSGRRVNELRETLNLLFGILSAWWNNSELERTFHMSSDYDSLLPVNLLIEPVDSRPPDAPVQPISYTSPLRSLLGASAYVELRNCEVIEVDRVARQVTLNLKRTRTEPKYISLRVRLTKVPDIDSYHTGEWLPSVLGRVIATRQALLEDLAQSHLPESVSLSTETIEWSEQVTLPNPLIAWQQILAQPINEVLVSVVHLDLNLDNILVDPKTGQPIVIDFASVRRGHVLHDLLRLETEVVTRLISEALDRANLSLEIFVRDYQLLHKSVFGSDNERVDTGHYRSIHQDLVKPLNMLRTIRRKACKLLRSTADWPIYYRGLVIYLLGSLKLDSLDNYPRARQLALVTAGAALSFLEQVDEQPKDEGIPILPPCPYRAWTALDKSDHKYFFGREKELEKLFDAVQTHSLVAVTGPSGSGKSSLVHAGLLPRLAVGVPPSKELDRVGRQDEKEQWVIATFCPTDRPFEAAAEALLHLIDPQAEGARLEEKSLALAREFESMGKLLDRVVKDILQSKQAAHLLLVVDQFDQLYTKCQDAVVCERFLQWLLGTLNTRRRGSKNSLWGRRGRSSPELAVLVTLRTGSWKQLQQHRWLAELLHDTQVLRLAGVHRSDLERAIRVPAQAMGVSFEGGLLDLILDELVSPAGYDWGPEEPGSLILAGPTLQSMWQHQIDLELTLNAYQYIGRVGGVVVKHAEDIYARLSQDEQHQVRRVLMQLVRWDSAIGPVRYKATRAEYSETDWFTVCRLADERLVVIGPQADEEETVRLVHPSLIREWKRLTNWLDEDREFLQLREKLTEALRVWERSGRERKFLLDQETLTQWEVWRYRWGELSLAQLEYLVESTKHARPTDKARHARWPATRIAIILLISLALALYLLLAYRWGWLHPLYELIKRLLMPLGGT